MIRSYIFHHTSERAREREGGGEREGEREREREREGERERERERESYHSNAVIGCPSFIHSTNDKLIRSVVPVSRTL